MSVLYGWQRKVALLPLTLSVVGWVIFTVGFVWILIDWPQEDENKEYKYPRASPLLIFHYVLLVGGPIVYLLGVVQAVLPGTISAVFGIPTAFLSTIYRVAAGEFTYEGAVYVKYIILESQTIQVKHLLMYIGAWVITFSWCLVMMLSVCYKSRPRRNPYALLNPPSRPTRRKCPFTPGFARGLIIPFVILSAAGWCVFTMGVCKYDFDLSSSQSLYGYLFAMYGAIVVGPLLFLAALLHAGCSGGASTVMGVFASILSTVYMVFMGFMVYIVGYFFYYFCQMQTDKPDCSFLHSSLDINLIYIFAGGVGSLFFWTFVLTLWPFYRNHHQEGQDNGVINATSHHHGYGTIRLEESFNDTDASRVQNSV